jgi:hypothetical protein
MIATLQMEKNLGQPSLSHEHAILLILLNILHVVSGPTLLLTMGVK